MRHRLALVPAALLLLTGLSACGDDSGSDDSGNSSSSSSSSTVEGVTVSGDFGAAPEVELEDGLEISEPAFETVIEGDGPEAKSGEKVLFHLTVFDASTGKKAGSTLDQGMAQEATVGAGQLPAGLDEALTGQTRGSRVVSTVPTEQSGGQSPVVVVTDLLSVTPEDPLDGPEGEEQPSPEGFPTLDTDGDTVTGFDFSDADPEPSKELQVETLVEGDGEQAIPEDEPRLVTIDYVGQVYGRDKPFNNSFEEGAPVTFAIGNGSLIRAWDEALAGVEEGSRVVMTVPPDQGYGPQGNPGIKVSGKDTLVFVIDVLGVDA